MGIETASITIRVPKTKKQEMIDAAKRSGFPDLTSYILAILNEYSVALELKKIEPKTGGQP